MAKRGYSRVKKNIAMQYGFQAAKYLFPFITIPYLTRVLGPDVYAVRAYVLAAMTFMQVFLDYGFNAYGTKVIAENRDDLERIKLETTSIILLRLGLSIVGAAILALISPLIPILLANPIYVAIAFACVCFKSMLPDFVFQGLEDMGIITYRFVTSQAVSMILIFVLVHGPGDLLWVPALEALAAAIAFVWSWANVLHSRKITLTRPSMSSLRGAFFDSSVFFLANAAATIFSSLTTLMIGLLITDAAQISYWSIAMTAIQAAQSLYTPITNSVFPHMCNDHDYRLITRLLKIGMPVVLIGTVAFALLSKQVMWVIGGEQYLAGSYVIALVSPVLFFSFPGMLFGYPVLAAVGEVKKLTASAVAAAVFHIAGLFFLAFGGWFTIESVALLRCCTEALLLMLRVVFVFPYLRQSNEGEV